jgi:hypothetical protein
MRAAAADSGRYFRGRCGVPQQGVFLGPKAEKGFLIFSG